jgi:uncharacterized membrane protein YdjX (TVP38/TMEM64 family)
VRTRRTIHWQLAGLALLIALLAILSRFFPMIDFLAAAQRRMAQWGPAGALCYPLLFAFCNVFLLPGGVVCVGAGFFFGLWWGFILVFAGNAIGAAISFALSRWLAGHWLKKRISRNRTLRALAPAVERDGWKIIVLSQLHPLFPTSLFNYVYGLTNIRFLTYMFWVSIGRAPGLFLYVYVGTLGQLGMNMVRGESHPKVVEFWIWGGALILMASLLLVFGRMASRAIQEAERASNLERSPAMSASAAHIITG